MTLTQCKITVFYLNNLNYIFAVILQKSFRCVDLVLKKHFLVLSVLKTIVLLSIFVETLQFDLGNDFNATHTLLLILHQRRDGDLVYKETKVSYMR